MRRPLLLASLLLVLAAPLRAYGQAEDADALIKHGLLLRRQGKDTEALDEFRRAYAAKPSARGLAQIALAEQALGRWVVAEADLQKALGEREDAWIAANRAPLESGLGAIRGHLGWLEVNADVASAELWVNDAQAGTLPLSHPIRVEAGSAVVEVRAAGYAPARRLAAIEPGGTARETVHLVPLAEPGSTPGEGTSGSTVLTEPTLPARVIPARRAMRNAGLVVVGGAVLDLAAGVYFGVRTIDTKSQRDAECTLMGGACNRLGVHLDDRARSYALASTAWFVAGAAATVTGVGLLWVSRSRTVHDRPAEPVGVGELEFVPEVGPDRAGVRFGGSW